MKKYYIYIQEKTPEEITYIPHPELSELLKKRIKKQVKGFRKI